MKKRYTKRQILESIKYWQKQLENKKYADALDEDSQSADRNLQQLMSLASKISPKTAELAKVVKNMQDNEVNESTKAALFSLLGALMLAVGCTKECAKKIETPLDQAAQIMQGTSEVKDLKEQLKILDAALEQIGDATSGMVGDTIEKWGTGKINKADTDATLSKLGNVKRGLKAKKAQIVHQVFDQIMSDDSSN